LQPPQGAPPPPSTPSDVELEIDLSSEAVLEVAPEPTSRSEPLVTALKKIVTLSKNGRADDAYREYEALFASETFSSYTPEEQRQALKLMVLAKGHGGSAAAVEAAHRAALARIEDLARTSEEAQDQELLGVTHLALGDEASATAAFQAGLAVERAKNPQSELIATLMRRVSQI